MNKSVKKVICLLLGAMMAFSFTACGGGGGDKDSTSEGAGNVSTGGTSDGSTSDGGTSEGGNDKEQKYNTETRPIVFATESLDGNFNPFFATSATDSNMAAMTQIGMLTTEANEDGADVIAYGKDQPVVTLDLKQTMTLSNGTVTQNAAEADFTEYSFIIKNGIKFSNGSALTIDDVLFNLYVYLDPAYLGSATIYSTDIVGLKAYRAQDPDLQDNSTVTDSDLNADFYAKADTRLNYLINHLLDAYEYPANENTEGDIERTKELFKEEAASNWSMTAGTLESYEEKYSFTEDWQIYYYNMGIVRVSQEATTKMTMYIDPETRATFVGEEAAKAAVEAGTIKEYKYMTNLDPEADEITTGGYNPFFAQEMEEAMNDTALIAKYVEEKGCTEEEAKSYIEQDTAITNACNTMTATEEDIAMILMYWATGSNLRDEIAAEARTKYYEEQGKTEDGKMRVPDISGITTSKTSVDFSGNDLGAEHDVLNIKINKVDPKAIWNFAFAVAPMYYYSNEWAMNKENTPHGVIFADNEFFDKVLQDPDKNGLPQGAGVYMPSNEKDSGTVTRENFYKNKWVYFKRNPYFYTVLGDGNDTSNNAKIKYLHYREVGSSNLIEALETKSIDVGEPNATADNLQIIDGISHLSYETYLTNGYGYVGINPKYVPDIEVRRAIMQAMDKNFIVTYYTEQLVDLIERPMSITNWAYPDGATEYPSIAYNPLSYEIEANMLAEIESNGGSAKKGSDGVYIVNDTRLEFTFTIAGDTTDHPAYQMFMKAKETLEEIGFKITVNTDIKALTKLSTGQLTVWAAAWSSTVDPDLYQVYHKDSKATSIKNWGYTEIFKDTSGEQFGYEQKKINALSALIEEARTKLDEESRAIDYAEALDLIMDLAVELPTYQRNDCLVYNKDIIDSSTLNDNPTANSGVIDKMWELNYN
ncbi:MAG: hypothetical protein IJY05_02675 [Clostridia bacterium]|nr:hypothetical protein [Clostridia bacterium]